MRFPIIAAFVLALPIFAVHSMPVSRADTGHITVPVTIDDRTHEFVFDTGAQGTVLYANFVEAEGIELSEKGMTIIGQTGEMEIPLARLESIIVDEVETLDIDAVVLPARKEGPLLNGIVGLDVMGDHLVELDLNNAKAHLHADARAAGVANLVPITAEIMPGGLLAIPVSVGGVETKAIIDTGARTTKLNQTLATRLGLSRDMPGAAAGDVTLGATNNAKPTWTVPVEEIRIGSVTVDRSEALLSDVSIFKVMELEDEPAILLGVNWLEEGRMGLDFEHGLVWFESE